jgi:nitroreductase
MKLDEIIANRKSIRAYLNKMPDRQVIEQILNAACQAPSACNKQPCRFVVAQTPELKDEIIKEGLGGLVVKNAWAKTAPVIIVVCAQRELLVHSIGEKVQGVKYHLIDIGIACEHLVLKACELGLGSCYIGWFDAKAIKKVLQLPRSWDVECLITLGYPDDRVEVKSPEKKSLGEVVLWK